METGIDVYCNMACFGLTALPCGPLDPRVLAEVAIECVGIGIWIDQREILT